MGNWYNLGNETERKEFARDCNRLYMLGIEKGVWVEMSQRRRPRTLSQNNYLHVLLSYFASQYGCSLETAKYDFFKKRYNSDIFVTMKRHQGRDVLYVKSTTSLDTKEMSLAINRFKNKVLEEFELLLPDADNYAAIKEAEREIKRYAEFL